MPYLDFLLAEFAPAPSEDDDSIYERERELAEEEAACPTPND